MPSYTLSVLSELLYDQLDNNTGLYPQAQITGVLNDATRKLNNLTGLEENTVNVTTTAGTLVYSTPSGVFIPTKLYFQGKELQKASLREIGTRFRNWAIQSMPTFGPIARWAPIGLNQFVIHPFDSVGGNTIEVQGVAPITPMASSGDTVTLDDDLVPTLIDYCRGRTMLKIGGRAFAGASLSYQAFIREVKELIPWAGMVFPRYFVESAQENAEGRSAT